MLDLLGIVFPVFALIGLGYLAVRRGAFVEDDIRVLGKFMVNFSLPALLFNAVTMNRLSEVINPTYIAAYSISALILMGLGYALFAAQGLGGARRGIAGLGMCCSNSGVFGYPIMALALPDVAPTAFAMNASIETFLLIPVGLFLMSLGRPAGSRGRLWDLLAILGGVLRRPMMLGLLAGLTVTFSGVPVPGPLGQLLSLLAGATVPVALFVVGGTLATATADGDRSQAAQIVVGKLVAMPALTAAVAWALALTGYSLSAELYAALILTAGLPMISILTVLAQGYGRERLASQAVFLASVGSFFTLTFLLWLLT